MPRSSGSDDQALGRFFHRVWRVDVEPLLRGKYAGQRRKSARVGGKVAATGGLVIDTLFRLRGKPFTRAMSVMGSSLGALLPDVWDWKWFKRSADQEDRKVVAERVRRRAAELSEVEALELFGLAPTAEYEQLKFAWRTTSQRWHPDKAPNEAQRAEFHLRFVAYQAAYEKLCVAYEEGRLPRKRAE